MRLINLDHSPYATRVRVQIYKKRLPVDIVSPDMALRTPEFLSAYPLGKIPLLELDDNQVLAESIAIMEYIEDVFPAHPLRPLTPLESAHSRIMSCVTDTHLAPVLLPYFKSMMLPDFTFDKVAQYELVRATLVKIDRWLDSAITLESRDLWLGDIVLAVSYWWVDVVVAQTEKNELTHDLPALNRWWQWVNSDAAVQQGISEMANAFKAFQQQSR